MDVSGLPVSERLLIAMHNLCAINGELAKRSEELARFLEISLDEVNQLLDRQTSEGYSSSYIDREGKRRNYLTGAGIIRACSFYS